ncbi:MAG TPA: aminopeptidase P family protein [Phycisphaerae bacterium]|nr:aminopeptidase P family protein [Phycisphaerae bacterium]
MARTKKKRSMPRLFADRIAAARARMAEKKLSAYLVTNHMDYHYFTGFTGEDSAVLITPQRLCVISDSRFDEALNQECPWLPRVMRKGLLEPEIGKVCRRFGLPSLAVQADHMTLEAHAELRKAGRPTRLVKAPPIANELRVRKDAAELKIIDDAIKVAQDAFKAMCRSIRVGQTEQQLAARLEYEMLKRGASGCAFPSIVAEGPNAALPHAHPGSRQVKRGSAILFDWGAIYRFYRSDLTRMVFVGTIPPRIRKIYGIVLEAQQKAIAAIRPGERMCDVDAVARKHIKKAGFGKYFGHGLGHGLGLDTHEAPSLSWRSQAKLEPGMVVTVEPGIYLPGVGGVRIEDDILVTASGTRVLSSLSSDIADAVL